MRAIRFLPLVVLLAAATPAQARLQSQGVAGIHRLCNYTNSSYARRQRETLLQIRIGRGEPCPVRLPRPRPPGPPPIPSMASLAEQRREPGRSVCVYQYMGRRYTRALPSGSTCPLTPHFSR